MPTDTTPGSGGLKSSKPTTRTSIRQSLNLSSVGKAFADVMNKSETRVPAEKTKKVKDTPSVTSSRRSSAVGATRGSTTTGRTSVGGVSSPATRRDSTSTVDSRTVTRHTRRSSTLQKASTTVVDEMGVAIPEPESTPPKAGRMTRSSSLRPRSSQTTALPKYRPKSIINDSKKPASPARAGTRRRLESSDDEREEHDGKGTLRSPEERSSRPISPLPSRASAVRVNLASQINITPSSPEKKSKMASPKPNQSTTKASVKPTKAPKASTPVTKKAAPARTSPSSSSRTTPPTTPRTPKAQSTFRSAFGFGRSNDKSSEKGSSALRNIARSSPTPSPAVNHSRKGSATPQTKSGSPSSSSSHPIDSSEDSFDVEDVEMLLAPTASLTAPTPAIPRFQSSRSRRQDVNASPSHIPNQLQHRSQLSYTSPLTPTAEESPSRKPANEKNSLMSWDQLAKESSRTMSEEEAESMITGLDLPFESHSASPEDVHMHLIPESPCLSALPSPGGYASISHVLLPDVTPSPAPHSELRYENAPEIPAVDAAIVTLLRLQLASAENTAKERLHQLQSLEEQLHNAKESRAREASELAQQVSFLEEQTQSRVNATERTNEERSAYIASLEDQLRHAEAYRDQAIEEALGKSEARIRASQEMYMQQQHRKWELAFDARNIASNWEKIHSLAEDELHSIRADRELLAVLLAGLDQSQMNVCQTVA